VVSPSVCGFLCEAWVVVVRSRAYRDLFGEKLGNLYLKLICANFFTKILQDSTLLKIGKVVFFLICNDFL